MGWFARRRASGVNERGREALDAGSLDEATRLFEEAIAAAPGWEVPWFNLGLVHKQRRQWAELLRCCDEATRLAKDKAAFWNLGIAATALGDWEAARRGWGGFGITVPPGPGPIRMKLGMVPIRVNPEVHPEVVWCERIDPARGIIRNIPLPDCERRFGDVVLHDGEPKGKRSLAGREVPVFNELSVLEASELHTFGAKASAATSEDLDDLERRFVERDLGFEDWTASVRMLCQKCSEGTPHEHEETAAPKGWSKKRRLGIAARNDVDATAVLVAWSEAGKGRSYSALEELL